MSSNEDLVIRPGLNSRLAKRGLANKPAHEFDNFYTPQNSFFYSQTPYLPLDPKRREIRLLRVFPRMNYDQHLRHNPQWALKGPNGQPVQFDDQSISNTTSQYGFRFSHPNKKLIACELVDNVALSRVGGDYCVLSYCAGSPINTAVILVDGLPFNAFENLELAIGNAYEYWTTKYPGRELLLWADQICINQQDLSERASQVRSMKEIYRRGNETLVSLSVAGSRECLAWSQRGLEFIGASQIAGQPTNLQAAEAPFLELIDDPCFESWIESFEAFLELIDDPCFESWIESFEAFLSSPWWNRAWVYQEFLASPRPRFVSFANSISWDELYPKLKFICNGSSPANFIKLLNLLNDSVRARKLKRDKLKGLSKLHRVRVQLSDSSVSSMMEGKISWKRSADIKTLLHHSRHCQTSDPRDRVYAFLALSHKGYDIAPNYTDSNTIVHVLIDTAMRIIKYDQSLQILHYVNDGREKLGCFLPSWVPDWTSPAHDTGLKQYLRRNRSQHDNLCDIAASVPLIVEYRPDLTNESVMDIGVKGVRINIVDKAARPIKGYPYLMTYSLADGRQFVTSKFVNMDDELWLLYGARLPVILRPENDDMYGFLSECVPLEEDGWQYLMSKYSEMKQVGPWELAHIWVV